VKEDNKRLKPILEKASLDYISSLFRFQKITLAAHHNVSRWKSDHKVATTRILEIMEKNKVKDKDCKTYRLIRNMMLTYTNHPHNRNINFHIPTTLTVFNILDHIVEENNRFPTVADKNLGVLLDITVDQHHSLLNRLICSSAFVSQHDSCQEARTQITFVHINICGLFDLFIKQQHGMKYYKYWYDKYLYHVRQLTNEETKVIDWPFATLRPIIKIHKDPWKMRPIIANTKSPVRFLSLCVSGIVKKWIFLLFRAMGVNCPIIYDTFDFIKRMSCMRSQFHVDHSSFITHCCVDVESYYTSIPSKKLIENIKWVSDYIISKFPLEDPNCIEMECIFIIMAIKHISKVAIIQVTDVLMMQKRWTYYGKFRSTYARPIIPNQIRNFSHETCIKTRKYSKGKNSRK